MNGVVLLKCSHLGVVFEKDKKDQIPIWPSGKSLTGRVIKEQKPLILKKEEILNLSNAGEIELIGTRAEVWIGVPLIIEGKVSGALVVQDYDNPQAYNQTHLELLEMVSSEMSICIERKQSEQALIKSEVELRELNATKDKLFSIIAHDLRSPFNNILGFSELLIENSNNYEAEETEKFLGFINLSAKNTLVLLDNLLNWAKSQTGQVKFKPEKLVLSSIVFETIELSKIIAIGKDISISQNKLDDTEVYADKDMLKTLLRNLISNAIKFTNPGGNISVSAKKEQSQVEIAVSDNGVGMNEETINKLFSIETNNTSIGTADEKGSGLGLILCKELVEKQGGKIWVESELGKGSIFKFILPMNKIHE